jgi:hypothetical protein
VYSIPCNCGRYHIDETSTPLEVRIKEHRYNVTQGLLEKSKLDQHAYEDGHNISWKDAKVLKIEQNTTYKKYKESVHMSLIDHPISQPSLDICPIWTPVITAEVKRLHLSPLYSRLSGKICVGTISGICLSSDDFNSNTSLVQGLTGRIGMHIGYWWACQKEGDHWEDQDVGGWTILKWILER